MSAASTLGNDLQAMRDQVKALEQLAGADKEDFEAINRSMQKALVATQNASIGIHHMNHHSSNQSSRGGASRGGSSPGNAMGSSMESDRTTSLRDSNNNGDVSTTTAAPSSPAAAAPASSSSSASSPYYSSSCSVHHRQESGVLSSSSTTGTPGLRSNRQASSESGRSGGALQYGMAPKPPPRPLLSGSVATSGGITAFSSSMGGSSTSHSAGGGGGRRPSLGNRSSSGSGGRGGGGRGGSPLEKQSGGSGLGYHQHHPGGVSDPVLEESLVASLVGEGVGQDLALAAVQGSGGSSLDAAKRWIAMAGGGAAASAGGGGGRGGALRAVRQLRALDTQSIADGAACGTGHSGGRGAPGVPDQPAPRIFPTTATGAVVGISPIRGANNPCHVNHGTGPPSSSFSPSSQSSGRTPAPGVVRDGNGNTQQPIDTRQGSQSTVSGGDEPRNFSWCVPSPAKQHSSREEEVPTVQLQIRCQGGKLIPLSRQFYADDSLRTVMYELLRQHGSEVIPEGGKKQEEASLQESASFSVPFPRAKYSWAQLANTTVQAAGLGTRGTLIFSAE